MAIVHLADRVDTVDIVDTVDQVDTVDASGRVTDLALWFGSPILCIERLGAGQLQSEPQAEAAADGASHETKPPNGVLAPVASRSGRVGGAFVCEP